MIIDYLLESEFSDDLHNIFGDALKDKEELKLKRIREAYEDGVYTLEEFKESKQLITEHIQSLKERITEPQNSEKELRRQLIEKYKNVPEQLKKDTLSEAEKNDILKSFIDKIVFNRKDTSIELFFYR